MAEGKVGIEAMKMEGFGDMGGLGDLSDLGDLLEGDLSQIKSEDYSSLEEPHLLFDSQVLLRALVSLSVVMKDGQEMVSKSIMISPSESFAYLRVNTGEVLAEVAVPIENIKNTIKSNYIVEFKTLLTVARNSGAKLLVLECDKVLKVKVLGGEVEFESFALDSSIFNKIIDVSKIAVKPEQVSQISGDQMFLLTAKAIRTMTLASRPEDRRVRLDGDGAYSNFLSSVVRHQGVGIDVSFRAVDLKFLAYLLEGVRLVEFRQIPLWNYFQTERWKIALPKVDTSDLVGIKEIFKGIEVKTSFVITPVQFHKVLSMMGHIIGASGVVRLIIENGQLAVVATTSTGKKLRFPIATASVDAVLNMTIPVAMLISSAMMMRRDSIVNVGIDKEKRLLFDTDNMRIVFGNLNV